MLIAFPLLLLLIQAQKSELSPPKSITHSAIVTNNVSDSKAGSGEPANGSCSIVHKSYGTEPRAMA